MALWGRQELGPSPFPKSSGLNWGEPSYRPPAQEVYYSEHPQTSPKHPETPSNGYMTPSASAASGLPYFVPVPSAPPAPPSGPIQIAVPSAAISGAAFTTTKVRFPKGGAYHDVAFTVLFAISIAGVFALAILYGMNYNNVRNLTTGQTTSSFDFSGAQWGVVLGLSFVFAGVMTTLLFLCMRAFPRAFVIGGLWFAALILLVSCIASYASGAILPGVIFTILLALHLLYMWLSRHRVAFAAANLRIVTTFLQDARFFGVYWALLGCVTVYALYFTLWSFAFLVSAYSIVYSLYGLWRFVLVLNALWVGQVLANVLHVTVSGSFARWFFYEDLIMPPFPTLDGFKRAAGPSFGSICFGSLVVATVQLLKWLVELNSDSNNPVAQVLRFVVRCLLQLIENIVKYVNKYAFSRIAIYGQSYCTAGRETFALLSDKGFDMIINDNMIGGVCVLTSFVVALFTFAFAVGINFLFWKGYYWVSVSLAALLLAFWVCNMMMMLLESSVATLFIAFAEDPFVLGKTRPSSYTELQKAWSGRYGDKISHIFVKV
mmetsp:Transcript_21242/g.35113  ORF Transcript_21242/g.35113 Transcript_21242/m.35113 type:complete len:546 (-) Transcript_21242:276-1913(-)